MLTALYLKRPLRTVEPEQAGLAGGKGATVTFAGKGASTAADADTTVPPAAWMVGCNKAVSVSLL
jgi:hypothetical protein